MELALAQMLIIPWVALLWRLGGKGGFPKARYIRKLGVPISVAIFAFYHGVEWYWCAAYVGAFFGLGSLPNTLIGDSFWGAPWWLFVKGFLDASALILVGWKLWHFLLIMAAIYGLYVFFLLLISNIDANQYNMKHRKVEIATGILYGSLAFMVIT